MKNKITPEQLEKVFSLFCSNSQHRVNMQKPFIIEDYTYATDAYSVIRCKTENINFEYENKEIPPNTGSILPASNTSEIIDIESIDWEFFMTVEETVFVGEDIQCGNCDGRGKCDDDLIYKDKIYDYSYECPVCKGSGDEEQRWAKLTGNKTFDVTDSIQFKNVYFAARLFYRLKKVKDIIKADLELIYYNEAKKGIVFKIDFLEILIMPLRATTQEQIIIKII